MKKLLVGVAVVTALVVSGLAASAAEVQVSLTATGFQPNAPQINWGDTIVFTNKDSAKHTLLIPRLELTKDLGPGESFAQKFEVDAGSYQMRDRLANRTYNGRIEVSLTGQLTLKGAASVAYGKRLAVSGTSPYAETPVVLETRAPGQGGDWTPLVTVTPGADGSFTAALPLERGGRIQATTAGGQLRSQPILVTVVPKLAVSVVPRRPKVGRLAKIVVKIGPAGAARGATLETYVTLRKRWTRVKTTPVKATTGVVTFSVKATEAPTQYRITVARASTNPGYVAIQSKPFKITGA